MGAAMPKVDHSTRSEVPVKCRPLARPSLMFRVYCFLIGFSTLGTLASHILKLDPGPIAPAASILIISFAVSIIALELSCWRALVATAVTASTLEICSLYTGFPFGAYEYSDAWFPTVPVGDHRFPLLLPGAWILIVWGGYLWVSRFVSGWKAAVATAALAMAIDLPMERAMTEVFGYWTWTPPGPLFGAPVMNSMGWFLTAFLCAATFRNVEGASDRYSPRVLALFCYFVAASGLIAFWDWAWVLLILIGTALLLMRNRSLPS